MMEHDGTQQRGEVLVVEDTTASLKLLSDLLRGAGYVVRPAPDGELALWSAQSRPPELVLLDVRMPGIDGFEVCRRMKRLPGLEEVPVIFLSAQHDADDKLQGFRAGAVDFIGKPFHAEEVLARTALHIQLARTRRALARANLEQQAMLESLRSARGEIQRAERLAALGALVAGVAHELNTPIGNSVLAASTLLEQVTRFGQQAEDGLRRSQLDTFVGEVRQAAGLLMRNLDKSAGLIASFKQVASDQAGAARRRFELAPLVADTGRGLEPALQQRAVRLQLAVAPELVLESYPTVLTEILGQLAQNAALHGCAGGGTVWIEARAAQPGMLWLCVRDDGAGIAPAHLDRIFDPFFTTKLGHGSCGLGLNIVHNLVTNVLGGSIRASSVPGDTRFELLLPCQAPQLSAGQAGSDAAV